MTFLAPYALFGTLLLALPILVHLFRPRKMRQTPFSSLRWLRETQQRLSRRVQWHQWPLFLLRAGTIMLLVLALARPLLGLRGEGRPVDRFVVLDLGVGMAYQPAGQPSPLDRANAWLADELQHSRPGDRTALITVDDRPRLITPPVADAARHLPAVQAARAGGGDARLTAALPLVRTLLPKDESRDAELVFVTSNRTSAWRQGEIQTFMKDGAPGRVRVVDVGLGRVRNAWLAAARLDRTADGEGRLLRVELGSEGDEPLERRVRLSGIVGVEAEAVPLSLRPGQVARAAFKLPPAVHLTGQVAEIRLEPGDDLPADDVLYVNLDPAATARVLLVEPDTPAGDDRPAGLYLRAGLEALADAGRQPRELSSRSAGAVTAGDVANADVVLLAGVPTLPEAAVEALEKRVRDGAGLAMFLGDRLDPSFYHQRLHLPLQPSEGLLPVTVSADKPADDDRGGPLTDVRWDHPLLSILADPVFGDLAQAQFHRHLPIIGMPGKGDTVLARHADATPAILDHPLGAGRVLLFNTSANDAWTDLPRRKSYVPLLDRTLTYLTAGGVRRSFSVGEPVRLSLPGKHAADAVLGPDGDRLAAHVAALDGKTIMTLDEPRLPGAYRVQRAGEPDAVFVVNAGRGGHGAAPMDGKALREWWSPVPVDVVSEDAVEPRTASGAWPLWPVLLFLAGLLLLAETLYVAVLCPRANPVAVGSVVHRRGILRPTADTPADAASASP